MKGLGALDPRAAPLPHGTEVITGVDRVAGERTVPQGTIGRVVGLPEEGLLDVHVVGVGTLRYRREDLTLRKAGQARYATRRADTYEALMPCRVLETVVGSQAWGLADERSDMDTRGAFALPLSWTTGLADPPQDLVRPDGSAMAYWEVGKAIRQALRADPNTLEMLFVPGVHGRSTPSAPGSSRRARRSSPRRSTARSRATRWRSCAASNRVPAPRASTAGEVLGWLRDEPRLDARSGGGAARPIGHRRAATTARAAGSLPGQGVDQAALPLAARPRARPGERRSRRPGPLRARGAATTSSFRASCGPRTPTTCCASSGRRPSGSGPGRPTFAPTGVLHDRLLAIKRGEVALDDVVTEAEALIPRSRRLRRPKRNPRIPDLQRADALARRIHGEVARRFDAVEPRPCGRDAPPTFSVEWSS